ncbi:MAG: HDOD domain-containing protein [Congregibacter sp.]
MSDSPAFEFVWQLGKELAQGEFELPPFPDTALRVQECIRDPDTDLQTLAGIVATEPALAARLMRMANSAMMRRASMEITDINTAISRVGRDMVQNAAVSFAAREAFKCPLGSPGTADLNILRQHSVKVASISYALAQHTSYAGNPDEAMLAGLLHAVGKFYIYMKSANHPALFSDREALDHLVIQWHTGVARAIVESWRFPESIAKGVDEQELKERDRIVSADLSDILFLANIIARAGVKAAVQLDDLDSLARLRMDAQALSTILTDSEEEIASMNSALGG